MKHFPCSMKISRIPSPSLSAQHLCRRMAGNSLWQIFPPSKRECWLGWPERDGCPRFLKKAETFTVRPPPDVPLQVEKHGENAELRQKGKQATLSCGYGGSVGALKAMGALEAGMTEEELQPLVDSWRAANPNIVRFWWDVDRAVKDCIRQRVPTETHGSALITGAPCSSLRSLPAGGLPM